MNSPLNRVIENSEFSVGTLVFAKVRSYPDWPGKIIHVDSETYKNVTKYKVQFFASDKTANVNKNDLCHYYNNRLKYPVENISKSNQELYDKALAEIKNEWEQKPTLSSPTTQSPINAQCSTLLTTQDDSLCSACDSPVFNGQSTIKCDGFCRNNFHSLCVNIDEDKFQALHTTSKGHCEVDIKASLETNIDNSAVIDTDEQPDAVLPQQRPSEPCRRTTRSMFKQSLNSVNHDDKSITRTRDNFSQDTRHISEPGIRQEVNQFTNKNRVYKNSNKEWTRVNYRKKGGQNNKSNNGSLTKDDGFRKVISNTGTESEVKARPYQTGTTYSEIIKSRPTVKIKVVHGTQEVSVENPLKPAKRMMWLFLSGLDPSVQTATITEYLKSLNATANFQCDKIESRYNNYCSFKLEVPLEVGEELMHPNLWPQGCIIGKYKPSRINCSDRTGPRQNNFLSQTRLVTSLT
ncbi:PC4 and SFRS1-interacting protein [Homalodisca vitripennis]|nr:PC4 and SFRS1-interacting protein [Homalodisca vitripennis]